MTTIFDDITESDWKVPNGSIFDEIQLEEWMPKRTLTGTAKDIAIAFGKGLVGASEAAIGLSGLASKGLEKVLPIPSEYLEPRKDAFLTEAAREELTGLYSTPQQVAERNVAGAEGFAGTIKEMVKNPSTIGTTVAESVPSMLAGGGVGRGLVSIGLRPIMGAAIGEGLVSAGQQAEQIRQSAEDKKLSGKQALQAAASGLGTGIFAIIGGRIAQKLGFADIDTMLASSGARATRQGIAKRLIGGGFTEGVLEELPQSAQEQVWLNAATDRPLDEGVGKAAAQGTITGIVTGVGANLRAGKPETKVQPPQYTKDQIFNGLISGKITVSEAQEIKAEKPDLSGIIDEAVNDFQSVKPNAPETTTPSEEELANLRQAPMSTVPRGEGAETIFDQIEKEQQEGLLDREFTPIEPEKQIKEPTETKDAESTRRSLEESRPISGQQREIEEAPRRVERGSAEQAGLRGVETQGVETPKGETLESLGVPLPEAQAPTQEPSGPSPAAPIQKETYEGIQEKIDNYTDELIGKYGIDIEKEIDKYEIDKQLGKKTKMPILKSEYNKYKNLYEIRDNIGYQELKEFIEAVSNAGGITIDEAKGALKEIGITKTDTPEDVYFAANTLRDWNTSSTENISKIYNYFANKNTGDQPYSKVSSKFRWGGTVENPKLQGSVIDEDGARTAWDKYALNKTEILFNSIDKSQGNKGDLKLSQDLTQGQQETPKAPSPIDRRKQPIDIGGAETLVQAPRQANGAILPERRVSRPGKIVAEFNSKYPDNKIEFVTIQYPSGKPQFVFTPQSGPLKGHILTTETPNISEIKNKFDALEDVSQIDIGTPKGDDKSDNEPRKGTKGKLAVNEFGQVEKQSAIGRAWTGNQWKPITDQVEIKRGKNKGKMRVTFADGKKRIVAPKSIKPFETTKKTIEIDGLKNSLKNEKGSSQLYTDIINHGIKTVADLKQKGIESFRMFHREMRTKFKDVWEKIKGHMRALWDILNNQSGQVNILRNVLGYPEYKAIMSFSPELMDVNGKVIHKSKFIFASIAENIGVKSFDTLEDLLEFAHKNGYSTASMGKDGFGNPTATFENKDTKKAFEYLSDEISSKWDLGKDVFVRYGDVPESGRSFDKASGNYEKGVSVFRGRILPDGKILVKPENQIDTTTYHVLSNSNRPVYVIEGTEIGKGADGEPLLTNVKQMTAKQSASKLFTNEEINIYTSKTLIGIDGKLLNALKNEKGSSELVNDIVSFGAQQVQEGVKSFSDFTAAMKERFSAVWEKIKNHMRQLWNVLSNQRGAITLERRTTKSRADEILAKLNEPAPTTQEQLSESQTAEPENTEETDLTSYEKVKDIWFGDKDLRILQNKVENKNLQESIKNALSIKRYGLKGRVMDSAIQIYIDIKRNPEHIEKYYDSLTNEQKTIVDLSQNLPDEIKKIADKISDSYKKIGLEALDAGVIRNVLDNYAARIWEIKGRPSSEERRKFGTKTRHAKQRTFETILEGWSNGYILKVNGATNNLNILKDEIAKTIQDKKFLSTLMDLTDIDGNPLVATKQLGEYEEIKHPNFVKWEPVGKAQEKPTGEVKWYGKNSFADETGTVWERKNIYAPKKIAKNLNNILGTSSLNNIPGVHLVTKYNAIMKSWILQSSFFHHLAFMRSYYLGTNHKTWAEMNIRRAYKEGYDNVLNMAPIVKLAVKNGLTIGVMQDWNESLLREKTIVGKILDKTSATKNIKDKILLLREMQAEFLFSKFGAGLKVKAFEIEYRNQMKKYPGSDPDVVAKRVANLINDDFGGLHLGRIGRNPTTQHIFRIFALAPDWTESNIRTMVKSIKSGTKEETDFYRRFWAGVLVKGIGATVLANFLLAGGDLDELEKKYKKAWRAGHFRWLDIDITPIYKALGGETKEHKYFSILGHFKDPAKFIIHPIRSAHHKGSVVYKTMHEALTGTNWAGQKYITLSELMEGQPLTKYGAANPIGYSQIPSYAISQIIGAQPVQIQNAIRWANGEMEGFDAIANSMGLGTATTYSPKNKLDVSGMEDKNATELESLGVSFNLPSRKIKIGKTEIELEEDAYRKIADKFSAELSERFERLMDRDVWQKMSEERKIDELRSVRRRVGKKYSYYLRREAARQRKKTSKSDNKR